MRYIIAGGAGFIGSHMTEFLMKSSKFNDLIVIDNFITGNKQNLLEFGFPDDKIIKFDISDIDFHRKLSDSTNGFDPHVIFNFACPASPIHYQLNPIKTLETNFIGTLNCLRYSKYHGARFFQSSTSEIYGNPLIHPQVENYFGNVNTWGPRACYDEGKRVAESLCYEFIHSYMADVRVARIFNTYGPRMAINDGRVVSNFIVQALRSEPITLYGDGLQTRSMCYIDDMINGILKLMISDFQEPVNLGNPVEVTMLELAERVLTLTKSSSKIIYMPLPKDDPERRKPDISKAKSLGWKPKVSLDDGLRITIDYFRGKLNG